MRFIIFLLVLGHLSLPLDGIECEPGLMLIGGECSEPWNQSNVDIWTDQSSGRSPCDDQSEDRDRPCLNYTLGLGIIYMIKNIQETKELDNSESEKKDVQPSFVMWIAVAVSVAAAFVVLSLVTTLGSRFISKRRHRRPQQHRQVDL
ncbi:hypothetical protein DPEC_G00355440 [Dallia pectoralis]|uniref:Uncharacterized protein n=1 Tax=Dallia pectoralis TaxID=75939 RepID=A0ACC2EZG6_DALPE|nr:hypothetical protein DPEC_G00355440 [Dallia pectoralis]